jgi:hypothetical protein
VSQHARNAVGCRGDETFEGFGGFSNNPRARRARKTKNATGHLGLFSTAVGRDTVTDAGWFSDEDLGRDLVSSRDAPRVSHAIITPSLYFSPSTVVPVTYGVLRIAGRREGRQHGGTGKRERGDFESGMLGETCAEPSTRPGVLGSGLSGRPDTRGNA